MNPYTGFIQNASEYVRATASNGPLYDNSGHFDLIISVDGSESI